AIEALDVGESGTDSFQVTVADGDGSPVGWTYTVTVTGADDPATLGTVTPGTIAEVDQSASTTDAGLVGTLVGADVDGETLTYGIDGGTAGTSTSAGTVSKAGTYGTLTITAATGAYTFTNNTSAIEALDVGESGTDTFTLTVGDGDGPLVAGTYTVVVTGADDAPTLAVIPEGGVIEVDQSAATTDSNLGGTLVGADVDGETLSYGIIGGTAGTGTAAGTVSRVGTYGTVTVNTATGAYSFTKNLVTVEALGVGAVVTDLFTLSVNDGDGVPTTRDFVVRITGADDTSLLAAVPGGSIVEIDQSSATTDTGLTGTLSAVDPEGDVLGYGIVGGTVSGSLVTKDGAYGQLRVQRTTGAFEYAKNAAAVEALDANESASETFVVTVSDGDGDPVAQTYTVTVTGADDPPTLGAVTTGTIAEVDQSATTTDTGLGGALVGADVDGETLAYGIVDGVAGTGAATGTVSKVGTYGTLTVTTATGAYAFTKNTSAIEALDAGESGADIFTVTVGDGDGAVVTQIYTVSVSGADDPPILSALTPGSISEQSLSSEVVASGLTGNLSVFDVDGDSLTFGVQDGIPVGDTIQKAGAFGTLTVHRQTGAYVYAPNLAVVESGGDSETAVDAFTVTVSDGDGPLVERSYSVIRSGANDAPTLESPAPLTIRDTSEQDFFQAVSGKIIGGDADAGAILSFGITGVVPSQGLSTLVGKYGSLTVTNTTGGFEFTPNSAAINALQVPASETYLLTVHDGAETRQTVWVVEIEGVNDRPVGVPLTLSLDEDGELQIALKAVDPDSPSLTFLIATAPTRGSVTGAGSDFVYRPQANANGSDRFTFKVSDGSLESIESEVLLQIRPINDAPTLGDILVSGIEDTVVALPESVFRERYSDVEGSPLQAIQILSLPGAGTLRLGTQPVSVGQRIEVGNLGTLSFQPAPNDDTRQGFQVAGFDGDRMSLPASLVITLASVNDIPTLVAVSPTATLQPSLGGTSQPDTRVDVYADGRFIGSAQSSPEGIWSLVSPVVLIDGTYALTATSTDRFNQTSPPSAPVTLVVDTRSPQVPTLRVASPTQDQLPLISGSGEPGSRVQVEIDGRFLGIAPVDASGNWVLRPGSPIAEGSYSLKALSLDAAGNRSASSLAVELVVDLTSPSAPVIQSPASASTPRPEIVGTAEPGASVLLIVRQVSLGTAVANASGVWRLTPGQDLAVGAHVLSARARDTAGNLGPVSAPWNLTILNQPPEAPVIAGPALTSDGSPEIYGSAPPQSQVLVWEGGVLLGTTVSDLQGRWVLSPPTSLTDGGHLIDAETIDGFGNRSPRSPTWQLIVRRIAMVNPTVDFLSKATTTPVLRGSLDGRETALLTVAVAGRLYRSSDGSVSIDRSVGRWSLPIPPEHSLVAGVYSVEAIAYDVSGNFATDQTSKELLVQIAGDGSRQSAPVPVSPDALIFRVSDRNPLSIDLGSLFQDPLNRPLRFALTGADNVQAGLEGSQLRLVFNQTFNSQATIRVQVIADPGDPAANPVYAITVIYDADKDAIPDEVEAVMRDLNRDGVEDAYQNAVATFPMRNFGQGTAASTNDFISLIIGDYQPTNRVADGFGIVVDSPARINEVSVRQASELGEVPIGLVDLSPVLNFTVKSPTSRPDGSIVVMLVLYQPNTSDVVYKYGRRSPVDLEPDFYEFNWDGRTGGQFIDTDGDGRPNLLRLVYHDGERGDDDWSKNGVLVDPVFVATRDQVPPKAPIWTTSAGRVSMPRPPLAGTSEPLSMVRVYHGATQVGLVRADESGHWAVRPEQDLPDGRFEFQATATDFAGNVSSRSSSLQLWVQTQVVPLDDTLPRVPGQPMKIPVAQILTNDFGRSGKLQVTRVDSRSTQGGTVVLERGWIVYTPAPSLLDNQIDSFTYTASDGRESAEAQVHLAAEEWRIGAAKNLLRVIPLSVGVSLRFSVIPNQRYRISASNRIGVGEDWKPLGSTWSDELGRLEIRDPDGLSATRFYRVEEN
ncbi:MAG: hypothetical protein RJB04_829, partial [Verrucomicrobiota bacterium]